jgi:integrase
MKLRGLGSVFQPSYTVDGKLHQAKTWSISYSVHGRRVRESAKSTNRSDAVRLLKKRLAEAAAGKAIGPERMTLAQLLAMVETNYKTNGRKTLNRAQAAGHHLKDYFGDILARSITPDRIATYTAQRLEQEAKPATVNYELATLRRGFRLAADAGQAITAPKIVMLRVANVRKGFFEADQLDAVLKHLPVHLKPVPRAAYITGWRKQELLSRQWRHVDLKDGWLRLDPGETKNGEGREFPLTVDLKALLMEQRQRATALERDLDRIVPWVFFLPDGGRIGDFRKAWASACTLAGIPGRLLHDFRRTAVRNLERAGVPRSAAMQMTGHLTEAIYRRYAIVDTGMLKDAAAKLDTFHAAEKRPRTDQDSSKTHTRP